MAALPRNLILVGLVSLLTDASTELAFPLLPYFLTTLGVGALAVGFMEGLAESVSSGLKFASGRLSDRWRRRTGLAFTGYAFSALTKLGLPIAPTGFSVVALRALDRVGKGVRGAPRDALIADTVPRRRWGFAFGFHRALDTIGALLGPALGLLLVGALTLRQLLAAAAVPALLGLLLFPWIREPRRKRSLLDAPAPPRFPRDPRLFSYLLAIAVFTLGNFGFLFLLLRGAQVGLSIRDLLLLHVLYNAVYAGFAFPLGSVTDRVGRFPLVIAALLLTALANATAARFAPDRWAEFALPAILFGLASAAFEGNGRALAVDFAPARTRASVLGAYHATIGAASLPAGLLAGYLWDVQFQITFWVGALFALVALTELGILWLQTGVGVRVLPLRHPAKARR